MNIVLIIFICLAVVAFGLWMIFQIPLWIPLGLAILALVYWALCKIAKDMWSH